MLCLQRARTSVADDDFEAPIEVDAPLAVKTRPAPVKDETQPQQPPAEPEPLPEGIALYEALAQVVSSDDVVLDKKLIDLVNKVMRKDQRREFFQPVNHAEAKWKREIVRCSWLSLLLVTSALVLTFLAILITLSSISLTTDDSVIPSTGRNTALDSSLTVQKEEYTRRVKQPLGLLGIKEMIRAPPGSKLKITTYRHLEMALELILANTRVFNGGSPNPYYLVADAMLTEFKRARDSQQRQREAELQRQLLHQADEAQMDGQRRSRAAAVMENLPQRRCVLACTFLFPLS